MKEFQLYEAEFKNGEKNIVLSVEELLKEHNKIISFQKLKKELKTIRKIKYFIYKIPNTEAESIAVNELPSKQMTVEEFLLKNKQKVEYTLDIINSQDFKEKKISEVKKSKNSTLTGDEEGNILKECLNFYLKKLNLTEINLLEVNEKEIYSFSTLGDSLIEVDLRMNIDSNHERVFFATNESMKYAFIHLGFNEVISCNTHLIGTLFETIYYIADRQNNREVKEKIFKMLTTVHLKKSISDIGI